MSAERTVARLGLLIETIESECEPHDGVCHDHDLTDDGACALVADLRSIRDEASRP